MNKETQAFTRALAAGTILPHNYITDRVIGEGGFGITYCCNILHTEEKVAIKEYFPDNIAYRASDNKVLPYTHQADLFERERRHFLTEASILLEFQNLEHIVNVKDILEANGTIYLVMEYIEGITLKQYVTDNEPLSFDELSKLMLPVLRDLIQVHAKGLLHRDISPDNVILGTDNQLHLIDFGSAAFESDATPDNKTIILKSGYAPPEQYLATGKLGAWTDVYGICGTIYFALTGFPPTDALERLQGAKLPPLTNHAQIRSWQADIITTGLQLAAGDRYPTMEALYQALCIPPLAITSQRAQAIHQSYKSEKTMLPTSISYVSKKKYPSIRIMSGELQKKKAIPLILLALFLLFIYCGLGFSGIAVPFWPQHRVPSHNTSTEKNTESISAKDNPETTGNSTTSESSSNTDSGTNENSSTTQATTHATTESTTETTTKQTTQIQTSKEGNQKKSSEQSDHFITLPEDDSYDSFTN